MRLGRKRIDPEEVVKTICVNVKQKVLTEIEKEGNPKHIIEKMINEKYLKE
jgi:translation elongation factor EF-Ts